MPVRTTALGARRFLQLAYVELPDRMQWQRVQLDKHRRHHVVSERAGEGSANLTAVSGRRVNRPLLQLGCRRRGRGARSSSRCRRRSTRLQAPLQAPCAGAHDKGDESLLRALGAVRDDNARVERTRFKERVLDLPEEFFIFLNVNI